MRKINLFYRRPTQADNHHCYLVVQFFLGVLFFNTVLFSHTAMAAPKNNPLRGFLTDFKSLEASFTQTLMSEAGEVLEKTEGILYLQQPGQFHWSYVAPYEQTIISDGDSFWIYDQDLDQVTIRSSGTALDQTPAGIILGNKDIDLHFVQFDMGNIDGYDWIELTPRDLDAQYDNIRFGFDNHQLGMMIIADSLGQITRIDFENVRRNPELDASIFSFSIPDNVDIIDERRAESP